MRSLTVLATFLILLGGICLLYAGSIPVYTDPKAPERISHELQSLPRETRFQEWYVRLQAVETPHKRFADLGRGLCAAGIGLLGSLGFWELYHRSNRMRSVAAIFALWLGLWLLRVPFTVWYYLVRLKRFDYPVWGDSIAIPIWSECFIWLVGAALSSGALGLLLIRHPMPTRIRLVRPVSQYGWLRALLIGCWLFILATFVVPAIWHGDEGMVITGMMASAILLAFLAAPEDRLPGERLRPIRVMQLSSPWPHS